jgi:hypothetical protein
MPMSMPELERALRSLRLSGMRATLEARALQVANNQMDFLEARGGPQSLDSLAAGLRWIPQG